MSGAHSFHEMVKHLPDRLSKQMAENLSVPIAFVCLLHLANEKVCIVIFTARKRSLWKGNVFTRVCHSVHRADTPLPAQCMLGYTPWPSACWDTPPCMPGYDQQAGGTHPTGMHSCGIYCWFFKDQVFHLGSITKL